MKIKTLSFLALASLVSSLTAADDDGTICKSETLKVLTNFQGGNIARCDFSKRGDLSIQVEPENTPINSSPWYAFRLQGTERVDIRITLNYGEFKHRYTPDISLDGVTWQTYPADRVDVKADKSAAGFVLTVPANKSLVVAAQPLLTTSHYATWLNSLRTDHGLALSSIGESVGERDLWRATTAPKDKTLLLLGRQHPPETTGALALFGFIERLFESDALAERFRSEVGVLLYPLINPDGVDEGHWRHNVGGKDLNRDWGPFTQPENRAINEDVARWLQTHNSQLIKAIDFHSTFYEVFYTQPDQSATVMPDLLGDWLSLFDQSMRQQFEDFEIRRQVSKNPQVNAAKHYFFSTYGASSTTLEIGDDTDRDFIKAYGRNAAEAFMTAYFRQPKSEPEARSDLPVANDAIALVKSDPSAQKDTSVTYDVVFRGGLVVDGTGGEPFHADVGIRKGRVTLLSEGEAATTAREIAIPNKVISPGFIDIHTHARADLVNEDEALVSNYLTQGVTTVVIGNDGDGATRINRRFDRIFEHGAGVNVAQLVGHASLRRRVMDDTGREATPEEIEAMKGILKTALEEGAFGLSTGLFYADGSYATTEEVIELAKLTSQEGGIYESHIRAESSRGVGVAAAVDEVIRIAEEANIPAHIAHIKVLGKDVWGTSGDIVEKIKKARARGLEITADQYPWVASSTQLKSAVVSREFQAGGLEGIRSRLNDPLTRDEILGDIALNIERRGGPESLLLVETENAKWHGLRLGDIAAALAISPQAAAGHLLAEGRARVVSFNMTEADIETFMVEPWVATSSDGTEGHPRKFGSFSRKYDTYVRERETLTLEVFVRASTGLPAEILGLEGRGTLSDGSVADLVIFDPEAFRERATFADWNLPSQGVDYLLVNGDFAIDNGELTHVRSGTALRR